MNIREELLREHSKVQAMKITHYIGDQQDRFDELINLFLHDEYRVSQRASWVISHCYDQHPQLLESHIVTLWENLQKDQNDAVKRNTLRAFQTLPLPEEVQGIAATLCFDFLANPNESIAVRAHSMTVLYRLCLQEPELFPELAMLLEEVIPTGSAGLRSRGKKILKQIRKRMD